MARYQIHRSSAGDIRLEKCEVPLGESHPSPYHECVEVPEPVAQSWREAQVAFWRLDRVMREFAEHQRPHTPEQSLESYEEPH